MTPFVLVVVLLCSFAAKFAFKSIYPDANDFLTPLIILCSIMILLWSRSDMSDKSVAHTLSCAGPDSGTDSSSPASLNSRSSSRSAFSKDVTTVRLTQAQRLAAQHAAHCRATSLHAAASSASEPFAGKLTGVSRRSGLRKRSVGSVSSSGGVADSMEGGINEGALPPPLKRTELGGKGGISEGGLLPPVKRTELGGEGGISEGGLLPPLKHSGVEAKFTSALASVGLSDFTNALVKIGAHRHPELVEDGDLETVGMAALDKRAWQRALEAMRSAA